MELNFRKKKVLLSCSDNPHKNLISNHLNILGKILDMQMKIYDNFLIVGDFNSEMTESAMENFWQYSNISLADFHSEFLYWLGKHAPVKKR